MDLSGVKTKKEFVVREPKYLETSEAYKEKPMQELAAKKESKLSSFMAKRKEKKEKKFTEMAMKTDKQSIKLDAYQKKLELQEVKAKLAQAKATQRTYGIGGRFSAVAKGLTRRTEPSGGISRQKRLATDAETRRQIAQQRGATQYEREQYAKYGVRGEGDGEMPYYEKEHGKKLPWKDVAVKPVDSAPSSTITNGHRIPVKKSLKDELF
jgi:hypothetical protein